MMKQLLLCTVFLASAAPALAQQQPTSTPGDARAVFKNRDGQTIGSATLINTPNGVLIRAEVSNLPPGPHGFHIHETGQCDASGGFESAGGHYNPDGQQHGYFIEGGPHAGDMPNQTVGQDGKMMAQVFNPNVSFEGDATLFDDDGSALVVHATADDYRSQPSGAAGDRLACAVIERN
ncbi:superoxide dismutase family protein [Microvirga roseola]|uniref:superoxide dismutase family protein n=1 Tax=Microvirga roseola TaxID=2883126 RepID=UPI0038996417